MSTFDLNTGATAALAHETDLTDLPVDGELPPGLDGVLVRNGPNPLGGRFEGNDVLSWWPQPAMLHAIELRDGRAIGYRNRWARTRTWARVHAPEQADALPDTNPNVNVLRHAGETLALAEGGAPLVMTAGLDFGGASQRHPGLAAGMTAHPKADPETGELISFRAHWERPWLRYGVTGADGQPRVDQLIEVPGPSMMHDIAITARYSILLDLNVAYDFSMLQRGYRMPLRWHDERQSRLGVIPRHGGPVRWFEVAPCFIQHVVNAYDADDTTVVLDVVRYPEYLRLSGRGAGFEDNPLGVLWRYEIDLARGMVSERALDEAGIELPRINEGRTGRSYRYAYAVQQPTNQEMRGVVRYDLATGATQQYRVAPGDQNSEPVFVPRPGARDEDDGWVLVCVYRQGSDTSDVVVLDGRDLQAGPLATVRLPSRIPAGFHGAWLPREVS